MGWIRGRAPVKIAAHTLPNLATTREQTKSSIEHVEDLSSIAADRLSSDQQNKPKTAAKYPLQPLKVSDKDLPFINPEDVSSKRRPGALSAKTMHEEDKKDYWIVVDDVVYDCTSFITDHPGGEQVILSFVGENCSCTGPLAIAFLQRLYSF